MKYVSQNKRHKSVTVVFCTLGSSKHDCEADTVMGKLGKNPLPCQGLPLCVIVSSSNDMEVRLISNSNLLTKPEPE